MYWHLVGVLGKIAKPFEDALTAPKRRRARTPLPGHTLYHFQLSPFSWKARNAVLKFGFDIPTKDVLLDPLAGKELVKEGGKDQVPCLKIESPTGTRWMYESDEIIRYLKSQKA